MGLLAQLLLAGATFASGAFVGSQIDDSIDQHPANSAIDKVPSAYTVFLYGAAGLALLYGAQKTGLIKGFR